MSNIKNIIYRKSKEARKKLLRSGNKYAKEYVELLKEVQREISQKLLNEEETPYQQWRLQNLLKEIEKEIEELLNKPSKDLMKRIAEESLKEVSKSLKEAFTEIKEKAKDNEIEEIKKTFKEVFKQSAKDLIIKESFFKVPQEAIKFLLTYSMTFSDNLAKDLITRIKKEISLGILQGEGVYKIARRIAKTPLPKNQVFRDVYDRALTIARTETARAYTHGSIYYYNKMGITKVKWICGKNPCSKCSARCGIIYEAEVGGDIPLHPNCTCVIAPAQVGKTSIVSEKDIQYSKEKKENIRATRKILKDIRRGKLPDWLDDELEERKLQKHIKRIFKVDWNNLKEDRKKYYEEKFYNLLTETIQKQSRVYYFDDIKGNGKFLFVKYKTGTIVIIDKEALKLRTFFKVDENFGNSNKSRILNYLEKQKKLLEDINKKVMDLGDGEGKR